MSAACATLDVGATVVHPRFVPEGFPPCAVVVEVWPGDWAELDNGYRLPTRELEPVAINERWCAVAGYDGRYLISSWGKVVSTHFNRTTRTRLLRPQAPNRYPAVTLRKASGVTQVGINRLVAQHFLPAPAEARLTFVLPRDGNRLNLNADNLQWVDPGEVEDPVVAPRLHARGALHHHSRLTTAQVAEVRQLAAQGVRLQTLADRFGVSRPAISQIVHLQTRYYD